MKIITIYIPPNYERNIQKLIKEGIISNRSEAIRTAIREFLQKEYDSNLRILNFSHNNEPLSDEWAKGFEEKRKKLNEEKKEQNELKETVKELKSIKKLNEKKLLRKINDGIDDLKEKLGKMSDKVDNMSVKKSLFKK